MPTKARRAHTSDSVPVPAHARVAECVAEFEAFRIGHPRLLAADRELRELIEHPSGSAVLFVYGPTGAGKTTLIERVQQQIHNTMADDLIADPSRLPSVIVSAPAPTGSQFAWRDFFVRGLDALAEPCVDEKQVVPPDARKPTELGQFKTVDGARRVFEAAVRNRRPKAIFIDEGSHLTSVGSGVRLMQQLDVLKSLSDATETVFVVVGTYDVVAFRNLNGQLGRRCRDVHLPRYRVDSDEDVNIFRSVLHTFASRLPIDPALLVDDVEAAYTASAGCVGILKQWLVRALVAALLDTGQIERRHLSKTTLSLQALREIALEIVQGERAVEDTAETAQEVRQLLGLDVRPPAQLNRSPVRLARRRVGKRLPQNDPVPS